MNFLEFINNKDKDTTVQQRFNESFKTDDAEKVMHLMLNIFRKKIGESILMSGPIDMMIDSKRMKSYVFYLPIDNQLTCGWSLNYLVSGNSSEIYSINFYDAPEISKVFFEGAKGKSILTIYTLGTSVAAFIPIIIHIVNNKDFKLSQEDANIIYGAEKNGIKLEGREYYYGAQKYNIYENISDIDSLYEKTDNTNNIELIYEKIKNSIKGGSAPQKNLEMSIKNNQTASVEYSKGTKDTEVKIKNELEDPEKVFARTKIYISSITKGIQPGLIICGGPGTGKTYRVIKQLEDLGYVDGINMKIIKGKATTRSLYLSLYEYRNKNRIVVIDDADSLVGPKAAEDSINILKAALDSTASDTGRKISYKITGDLKDDYDKKVPKEFYYNGGVIVITNYSMGQLDTALRNRVYTQEITFSNAQILEMIKKLLNNIESESLSMEAKEKAYKYLVELDKSGSDMEVTIRSFVMCARVFEIAIQDSAVSDEDAKEIIAEQMKNMFARGGHKF